MRTPTPKKRLLTMLLFSSLTSLAQTTPPNPNPPPPGLPIDGYIWLLAIIALAFGVYLERSRKIFAKEERLKPVQSEAEVRSHNIATRNERSATSSPNNTTTKNKQTQTTQKNN